MIFSGPDPSPGLLLGPVSQPAPERLGLLGEPQPEQGVDREGGVPDPGVAVVPVALAADLLGQPGGGRGDQGAGGGVGHQLEGDRRAVDHLPPAAPVGRAGQPAPPEPGRLGEQAQQLLGGHRSGVGRRRPTPAPPRRPGRPAASASPRTSLPWRCIAPAPPPCRVSCSGRGAEHRPVLGELQLVGLAAVVEPGRALQLRSGSGRGHSAPPGPAGAGRWPGAGRRPA